MRMKFDSKKVNLLLAEMEVILSSIKATSENFQRELAKKKQKAA